MTLVRVPSAEDAHPTDFSIELVDRNERVEDLSAQVEKLGRQRPDVFRSIWHELGFCFSLLASMLMAVCLPSSIHGEYPPTDKTFHRNTSSAVSTSFCQSCPNHLTFLNNQGHGLQASSH